MQVISWEIYGSTGLLALANPRYIDRHDNQCIIFKTADCMGHKAFLTELQTIQMYLKQEKCKIQFFF